MRSRMLGTAIGILMAGAAFSQNSVHATIPFPFHVGTGHFEAGSYRLSGMSSPNFTWTIQADKGSSSGLFLIRNGVETNHLATTGILIFHRYGKTYFLSRFRCGGQSLGWELSPSRLEREVARTTRPVETAAVVVVRESPR